MNSRKEFLSTATHRLRFVFLPKHSSWLNQIEIVFGIMQRKCVRRGNFKSVSELEEKLRRFLAYYNETMAHPFDWTYTGDPRGKKDRSQFVPAHHREKLRVPVSAAA